MITVNQLTKKYGNRVAVNNISFEVSRGEILGFLGQNGAGKTTTMKMLTCFMPPTSGSISIGGDDVFDKPLEVKKRMGYLPENPPIYPDLLVREYLLFVAELRGVPRGERQQKMDRVLEKLNLGDVKNRLIGNLSKGYRQRVGLAQALIHEPEVLIMDEPTTGLDPKQVSEARQLIRSLKSQTTVIYSSHILGEVAATCDRILVIDQGQLVAQESLGTLGTDGENLVKTECYVRQVDETALEQLRQIQGVKKIQLAESSSQKILIESENDDECLARLSQKICELNLGLTRMSPMQMPLEEYYLSLIGKGVNS